MISFVIWPPFCSWPSQLEMPTCKLLHVIQVKIFKLFLFNNFNFLVYLQVPRNIKIVATYLLDLMFPNINVASNSISIAYITHKSYN